VSTKAHPTWFAFVRWLVRTFFFQLGGGFKSSGWENIPMTGAVIIAPNHVSNADPPAVACGGRRAMRFMAKEELFKGFFGKICRSLGAYPVKRGEGDTESIRFSIEMLAAGDALVVFPEGVRGDGITMNPISRGVAMLAKRTGVPVVPTGIAGTQVKMPRGSALPKFAKVSIVYGEPFTYADVATGANERENRELFCRELERRIIELCATQGLTLKTSEKS
jgi:1-acyl-sn-glycerol-3-phosphate acyltransferase